MSEGDDARDKKRVFIQNRVQLLLLLTFIHFASAALSFALASSAAAAAASIAAKSVAGASPAELLMHGAAGNYNYRSKGARLVVSALAFWRLTNFLLAV